jgi:hypothetical protein
MAMAATAAPLDDLTTAGPPAVDPSTSEEASLSSPTVVRPIRSTRRSVLSRAAVVAVVSAGVLVALWGAFQPPATVDLEITNSANRRIHVSVQAPGDRTVLGVGSVAPGESYRFLEVLDQGDHWLVIFESAGVDGGVLHLSRAQLVAADWVIEVPDEVDRRLAADGVGPSI